MRRGRRSTPTYGGNDRTHYIRVPDDSARRTARRRRIGQPVPGDRGGARAPGIDGIKRSIDPGTSADGGTVRPLPPTLLHAVDEFEADPVITGVLDAAGDGVAGYFADLKRDEFFAYHSTVSPWEIDQYLTAF